MTEVVIKRIKLGNDHDDTKWVILEGSIPGIPEITKRRAINSAALVDPNSGITLAGETAILVATVHEYHERHLAVQAALKEL